MSVVWQRMKSIYGHLWTSQFKDHNQIRITQAEWLAAFNRSGFTQQDVSIALDFCATRVPDMPKLPQFIDVVRLARLERRRQREREDGHLCLPETQEQREQREARAREQRQERIARSRSEIAKIKSLLAK